MLHAEPFLVGHRGYPAEAPENTVPSFELAFKNGASAVEGDFFLTKDGYIVCSHDSNLKRVTGVDFEIVENTFEDLRKLDRGFGKDPKYTGTTTPTFEEVAATIPKGKQFIIEIKTDSSIVEPIAKALKKSGLEDSQITFVSFKTEPLKYLKEHYPQWRTYWIKPFDKGGVDEPLKPLLEEIFAQLKDIKADGFCVRDDARLNEDFYKAMREAGYWVDTWVINDPVRVRELFKMGSDSVTTDKIGDIRRALKE